MPTKTARDDSPAYAVFMLALCFYALGAMALERLVKLDQEVRVIFDYADYAVCLIFFADFLICLYRAPNRRRYFFTWGWIDLLSSVPMLEPARWGRIARIIRVFRVVRGLKVSTFVAKALLKRVQSACLAASLLALLLVVFCSIAVLHFEQGITSGGDAIWWAFGTITTVGSEYYPVTAEGRVIACILMAAGVGLLGTFAGSLAAVFLDSDQAAEKKDIDRLQKQIEGLCQLLEAQNAAATNPTKGA